MNRQHEPSVMTPARSGVYRTPADIGALQTATAKAGLSWLDLPLRTVGSKQQFLAACAKQFRLPSHFGGNWDALSDCLRDFGWLKARGYVVHMSGSESFAKASDEDFQTALAVFAEAAAFWKGRGVVFILLVDSGANLPRF